MEIIKNEPEHGSVELNDVSETLPAGLAFKRQGDVVMVT